MLLSAALSTITPTGPPPLPRWHAFLSHAQASAGDQCLVLREALLGRGVEAWLDVDYNTSAESMREGAAASALFVLFLSRTVLARPFCQMEIKAALGAEKDMVFVLDEDPAFGGAPLEELIAEGRAFSAHAAQAAAGKVYLGPADFDDLFPGGRPAHPVVPFRRGAALLEVTVPALLAHIAASRNVPPLVPPSHPRLKLSPAIATLPRGDGCHVLIAASAQGTHQALFLQTALTARARGVRFVVRTLPPGSTDAAGFAAASGAALVVVLLTTDLWAAGEPLDAGVCGAVRAVLTAGAPRRRSTAPRRLHVLHEWDARHGGVYPISPLIDSAPPELRSLFDDFVAAPFERSRDKRALMLRDILAAAGAQAVGESGPFAVPPQPPFFSSEACAPAAAALRRALLQHVDPGGKASDVCRCIVAGGDGGSGKSTLAASVVRDRTVAAAFDDVLWVTVGRGAGRAELHATLLVSTRAAALTGRATAPHHPHFVVRRRPS